LLEIIQTLRFYIKKFYRTLKTHASSYGMERAKLILIDNYGLVMANTQYLKSKRWRIKLDEMSVECPGSNDQIHQVLPQEAGIGYSNSIQLEDGLRYIETQYTPIRDFSILSTIESAEPQLIITLSLEGSSRYSGQGKDVVFNKGFTVITTFTSSLGERQYEAGRPINQLRLAIRKNWLDLHFGENKFDQWFNKSGLQQISYQPISNQSLFIIKQLLADNIADSLQRVLMQGYVRVLLASELNQLNFNSQDTCKHYNKNEIKIANNARDILTHEYNNPPSLKELSKRVGTNPIKLKQLFHHYFNNTPYGLLFEIRMNQAYQLLKTTRCHVNIAADHVGYNHASNFSAAFTKYFGVSPKTVSKN